MEFDTILITGAAGFIGSGLVTHLLEHYNGIKIVGVDNLNDYYDVSLKEYRLQNIDEAAGRSGSEWIFEKGCIEEPGFLSSLFSRYVPQVVVNLAAQAGVRYSIDHPDEYMKSNVMGFYQVLEACRHSYDNGSQGVRHLVYASSSSVYGNSRKIPYSADDQVDHPVSLYAATKKSNELMAHCYSSLYSIPTTGLRFFTVYGPAGRPDMAYFSFADKLKRREMIRIFNYGNCKRDFTFIDDIVEGIERVIQRPPKPETDKDGLSVAPYALYNIGNSHPENLLDFVDILEQELKRAGVLSKEHDYSIYRKLVPMQPGDVEMTYADVTPLERDFGYRPCTSLREGLRKFAEWYSSYYCD